MPFLWLSLFRFLYFLIWLCMSLLELMTWSLGCYRTWSFQEIFQIIYYLILITDFPWDLFENFDKLLEHFCDMASPCNKIRHTGNSPCKQKNLHQIVIPRIFLCNMKLNNSKFTITDYLLSILSLCEKYISFKIP